MFIPRRHRPSVRQGFVRLRGLFALTLMMGMVAVLAGCGTVPGMGASSTYSLVGLWLLAVSTLGLLVGCGGPSLNASQSRDFPPTVAAAPTPTPAVPTAVALKFVQQPTKGSANAQVLDVITPSLQVEAIDQNGNRVTTFTDPISITLNAPAGVTLLGTTTRNAVAGVATFDDLRLSLAGVNYTLQATSITLQASTSLSFVTTPLPLTFAAQQGFAVGATPFSVAVGDLNLDGKPDLAIANTEDHSVSVLLGNGDGTFQTQQIFSVGAGPVPVGVGDLNLDGKPDLAIANTDTHNVSVLLHD